MADQKTASGAAQSAPSAPSAPAAPRGKLAPAAESGDPAVHQLLAEIQTAQSNGDDNAEKDLRKQLAELGYE